MKHKFISIFIALVLALSLCLVTAVPVAAATIINVAPGGSIQDAIDAAGPGDIILVAAGISVGDLVIPVGKDNLELMGAIGATIKGVTTFPGPFPDGVPNIDILSSGVKIHGFTIESPAAAADRYSMGMYIGASDVEIYDNTFLTHTQNVAAGVQYSVVIQTYRTGILEGVDISGLNIHDNNFNSAGVVEATTVGYDGIFVNLDTGSGAVTIVGNTFVGSLFRAISVERSNVVIGGNSIITYLAPRVSGTVGGYQGIYMGCFAVDVGDPPVQTNVSIIGNTVGGVATSEGFDQGIRVGSSSAALGFSGIVVSQNTVQYNTDGIVVRAPTGAAVGVLINYNNIVDNTNLGVDNATIDNAELDVTLNWWGTTDGAQIMTMVNGNVDYSLWLAATYSPSAVTMTAAYIYTPPVIGISVDPAIVDFGAVEPDVASAAQIVTVTNEGNVNEDFSTSIINESHPPVYSTGLAYTWSVPPVGVASLDSVDVSLVLTVPVGTAPGTYTATMVFWAEETPAP